MKRGRRPSADLAGDRVAEARVGGEARQALGIRQHDAAAQDEAGLHQGDLRDGARIADAARLDHDVVEGLGCREIGLIVGGTVAADGSRFTAVNTRDKNDTPGAIRLRLAQLEASIGRYLDKLDTADRQEADVADMRTTRLNDTGLVGYNVQAATDTDSHIVVAHEVTNLGHDRTQLANMGRQAKDATGVEHLTILTDRGYFSGAEVLACRSHRPRAPRRRGASASPTSSTMGRATPIGALPARPSSSARPVSRTASF